MLYNCTLGTHWLSMCVWGVVGMRFQCLHFILQLLHRFHFHFHSQFVHTVDQIGVISNAAFALAFGHVRFFRVAGDENVFRLAGGFLSRPHLLVESRHSIFESTAKRVRVDGHEELT